MAPATAIHRPIAAKAFAPGLAPARPPRPWSAPPRASRLTSSASTPILASGVLLRRLANPPADALKSEGAVAASYPPAVRRSRSAAAKRTAERYRRAAEIYEASRLHAHEPWDVPRHRPKDRPGSALPPGPLLESELRRGERATRPVATSVVFSVMTVGRLDDLAKPPSRPGSSSHHHRSAWVRRQIAGTPGAATYDTYAKRLAAG